MSSAAVQRFSSGKERPTLSRMTTRGRDHLMSEVFPQFTCICELCDCGRHKHHEDCKRKTSVRRVKPSAPCMITHYKDTFKDYPGYQMRGSKRPPLTPRDEDRGPMEGQTHNMREFPIRPINMVKSCKKIETYKPTQEPFEGKTVYKIEYLPKEMKLPRVARAMFDYKRHDVPKFDDRTMHKEQFKSWDIVRDNPQYRELPCHAEELVLPQKQKFNGLTVTRRDYPGKYMPKQEPFKMGPPQIDLMLEGDFDHNTVHNQTYITRNNESMRSPIINKTTSEVTLKRGKFYDVTQTKDDFQNRGKAQRFPMIPATDNILIDKHENQFFDTSTGAEYQGYDVKMHPAPSPIIYKDNYEMPTGKVEDKTVHRVTYTPKEVRYSQGAPKHSEVKYDTHCKPRFEDKTMNKECYKDWGTIPHVRQGDIIEGPRQQYSPPHGSFADKTTTKVHYPWKTLSAPVKNLKPVENYVKGDGEIDFKTMNHLEYGYKRPKMCRVELYLLQMALKKKLDASMKSKNPSLNKCTKALSSAV